MASKDFAILDIQNDNDELQFQDFGLSGNGNRDSSQTHVFTDFPDSPGHQNDREKLLGEYQDDEEATPKSNAKSQSFWSFEYYQQYFDVDSKQVGDRIMWSMVPKPGVNHLEMHIRPKPDLYGPFWVCLTLVFAAAIAGNVSNYLQTKGDQGQHWRYDFHKVSLAAGMVFSYGWLLPLLIWSGLRYKSSKPPLSLLELTCLYGYSLSVLVPVCLVWTAPIVWLRWCVGIVGVVLSGMVLAKAVWEGLKGGGEGGDFVEEFGDDSGAAAAGGVMKKVAMAVVLIVVVMHVAIAMGFMLYFFNEPAGGSGGVLGAPLPAAVVSQDPALPGDANARPTAPPSAAVKDIVPTKRDLTRASSLIQGNGVGPLNTGGDNSLVVPVPAVVKQPEGLESAPASQNPPRNIPAGQVAEPENKVDSTEGVYTKQLAGGSSVSDKPAAPPIEKKKLREAVSKKLQKVSVSEADGTKSPPSLAQANVDISVENASKVAANAAVSDDKNGRKIRSLYRKLGKTNT